MFKLFIYNNWIIGKSYSVAQKIKPLIFAFTVFCVLVNTSFSSYSQNTKIISAEYFWDTDPGFGLATSIGVSAGNVIDLSQSVDINSISSGFHRLYLRVKDENRKWSHTIMTPVWKLMDVNSSPLTAPDIVSAEYFWNTDPGFGNASTLSLIAGQAIDLSQSLDITSLTPGIHRLYIRTKDSKGAWSHTLMTPIWKLMETTTSPQLTPDVVSAEYFWDTDPGFGNATPLSLIAGQAVDLTQSLDISSLTPGIHRLYIRTRDDNGAWSHTLMTPIWKLMEATTSPQITPDVVSAEYFWDTDPGFGNATPLSLIAGQAVDLTQSLDITSLTPGIHRLYIRTRDDNGAWSHTLMTPIWKLIETTTSPQITPDVVSAEYFWDNDPGIGSGTALNLIAGQAVDLTQSLDITPLTPGFHRLYIRTKDGDGAWSHTLMTPVWKLIESTSSPAVAPDVVSAEYYWNTDPGFGNGFYLPVTTPNVVINQNTLVSGCGLATGVHKLYVRVKDDKNAWSHSLVGDVSIDNNGNPPPPVVILLDTVINVCENSSASFSVTVNSGGAIYQWQESIDNGLSWHNLTSGSIYQGINTDNLIISNVTASMDNYLYQCEVTACGSSVTSKDAILTIMGLPSLSVQPVDITQGIGLSATFNLTAVNTQTYQWYENSGTGWNLIINGGIYSGANTSALTISDVTGMDAYMYYCIINGCSVDVSSDTVTLTVGLIYSITSHPDDVSQCAGTSASFAITATGSPTYQWYENQGSGWIALSNTGVYSGVNTETLMISDITGMDGYSYQCEITGGSTIITSNSSNLTVYELPAISIQPVDVTECPGNGTSFGITAGGYNLTYQWYENQGSGWVLLADAGVYSGVNTSILNISDVTGMDAYQYKCIASGCSKSDTSSVAKLTLYSAAVINTQPSDVIICSGGTVFSVAAVGSLMSYQWYEDQGSGWVALSDGGIYSGSNSDTLFISDAATLNTYQYQCVITNCSYSVSSNAATLTYNPFNIWLGYATDWDNNNNWSCGIPTSAGDVSIPASPVGGNLPTVLSGGISMCRDITFEPGSGITIDPGANLSVYGDWNNGGAAAIGEGKIIFAGTSQIVTGTTTFGHITINTGSVVTLMSPGQKVAGIVLCNGILNANGNLTLLSNSTGTALISGNSTGSVNGDVTLQRFVAAAKAKGYKHYSTAFSNSVVGDFSNFMTLHLGPSTASPFPTLFMFSETAATPFFGNGWVAAAPQGAVNTPMHIGAGYTAQLGAGSSTDITTFLFGNVNNGDYYIPLTRNNPGTGKGDGWNLIGNPYPSPIDLHKLNYTTANLNKTVSIFISTSMYNGYYGYYNSMLGIPLNNGTRYLSSLHGFFVQCNNTSGGMLTLTNSTRSDILNPQLYKNDMQLDIPLVKLAAGLTEANSLKDETIVVFASDADLNSNDDYDASKIMNTEPSMPDVYTVSGNNRLAINVLPDDFNIVKEVPVGFSVKTAGIYSIRATEIANFPSGIYVYLEDKATGKLQNLMINPEYSFAADLHTAVEGRFTLIFGESESSGLLQNDEDSHFLALSDGKQLIVDIKGQNGKGSLQMFDALGRIIMNETIPADGRYTYQPGLPAAAYTVRYINGNNVRAVKLMMQ